MPTTLSRSNALNCLIEVIKAQQSFLEKPVPRRGWSNPGMTPYKQIHANAMLQAAHSSTNGGLLNVESSSGPPKTSVLSRRKSVPKQPEI